MIKNRLLLAKHLQMFGETATDNGLLAYEGALSVGSAVFVLNEDGTEYIPAPDGNYTAEDGTIIVVADGVVTEINEPKAEESKDGEVVVVDETETMATEESKDGEVVETAEEEPKAEETASEVLRKVAELEEKVAKLSEALAELIAKLSMSADEKAEKKVAKEEFAQEKKGGIDRYLKFI